MQKTFLPGRGLYEILNQKNFIFILYNYPTFRKKKQHSKFITDNDLFASSDLRKKVDWRTLSNALLKSKNK